MSRADLRAAALSARQAIAWHQDVNMANDPDSMWAAPLAALNAALDPVTPAQLRAKAQALTDAAPDSPGDTHEAALLLNQAEALAEKMLDDAAGRIVGEDVKLCVSWLVGELFKKAGERDSIMTEDEAATLAGRAPDDDDLRDALPAGDYAVHEGIDPADGAKAWRWYDARDEEPHPADSEWFETEGEALRDLYETEGLDLPDGSEAFEHWAVSRWLAEKLEAKGESVIETDWAGWVWARCTTGQMIRMDYVIRQIARDICADDLGAVA